MSKVAGCRDSAFDSLLAIFEQPVEVVDQRLNFGRVNAVDPLIFACPNRQKFFAQSSEGQQTVAQSVNARGHKREANEGGDDSVDSEEVRRRTDEH